MMISNEEKALSDLLQSLQIQLLAAYKSQVTTEWGEINSIPPFNKLYFIQDGEGWIRIGDQDFYPKPGQLCLLPAHVQHSFAAINGNPFLKFWCHFSITVGPFDLFQWIGVPLCIDTKDTARLIYLFQEMVTLFNLDSLMARIREKALLLEIVSHFLDHVPVHILQHRTEEMKRLNVIQNFVEQNLHHGLTVDQLAGEVHLHPNYFISYFKKHFGLSPLKYVNRKRTDRAKLLLSTTALSIKEVADQSGFKETNHFTKFFKKETGLSPTDYRTSFTQTPNN
ncbi:helix-turn-helix domain-containing protein [Paenibacillus sp. FA6]|uniref:helix-turn-helix domain-containing protein n=1 Tax=Paenibacillus sp. FA6 TaxID=3413029 RepID=UPI003F660B89